MSVFDLLRNQNSIEHAPEPELAPAAAPGGFPPGGAAPGTGPAIPVSGPAIAPTPASAARVDPPGIQAQYYIENAGKERRYYKDLEGKQLAFRADNKAVTTKQEDRTTVSHMLDVAQSNGWTSLHVRGTAAFKREAWIEAQARGLSVKGHEPTADDRRNVEARRDTRRQSQASTAATTTEASPAPNAVANTSPAPMPAPQQAQTPAPTTAPAAVPAARNGTALPEDAQAGKPTKAPPKVQGQDGAKPAVAATTDGADVKGADAKPDIAAKLSPSGKKVLAFLEQRIETQMAKLTDDVKADLRAHAAQAIAKRESEVGPVKLPAVKADRKQQAGRDQAAEAPKRKAKADGDEQKPKQVQQPRMSMG